MGGGGAASGISHPFSQSPSAVPGSHPYAFLQPLVHQRGCARGGTLGLVTKGAVELAPLSSPGFYSFVDVPHFQMETIQSVLLSVRQGDWRASIDLREAYL